jgi:hypothetical protein
MHDNRFHWSLFNLQFFIHPKQNRINYCFRVEILGRKRVLEATRINWVGLSFISPSFDIRSNSSQRSLFLSRSIQGFIDLFLLLSLGF